MYMKLHAYMNQTVHQSLHLAKYIDMDPTNKPGFILLQNKETEMPNPLPMQPL